MAKIQLKSDNINPFGGLFSIFKQFDRSGLRRTIDSTLGHRGTTRAAFSYGDVFASLFGRKITYFSRKSLQKAYLCAPKPS